ncbi:hypothetical protein EDB81DRAFT_795433 [Dactylonectria macrodidyma]|uniref:AGC-kinase C-terminal domain-containing protein n=1 Tax=Dactylonectria macrodidyma TaxID=307937 RepID=A0A9P9EXP6_9HYPO|nr:hypothetical protein EDB81DRAFT_795433 [Dactylonectria macrodidyma]
MLSHLRFHRRGPSNPTSPLPDQHPTSPPTSVLSPYSSDAFSPELRPVSSNPAAQPPTLPPISRVTSAESDREPRQHVDMTSQPDPRSPPTRSPYNGDFSFIGGVALRKYRRDMETQSAETTDPNRGTSQSTMAPVNLPAPSRPPPQPVRNSKPPASFSTPTELHNSTAAPTGRRPAGTRLHTDLPTITTTTSASEIPKPKKGLPFLKNPMSTLLMRRKTNQKVPNLVPLPLNNRPEEPMYDPRIKGTRVHDFSAPRPKRVFPTAKDPAYVLSSPHSSTLPELEKFSSTLVSPVDGAQPSDTSQRNPSNASGSVYSQDSQTTVSNKSDMINGTANAVLPPPQHAPPVPPKNDAPISVQPRSSQASRLIDDANSVYSKSSTRIARSRGPSMSGKDGPSALPRHMKSTSSRFSFDMVGAAKQEKLLEDRHRQRELEKQTTEPDLPTDRDSRFDDFDEDAFDYDAMMDDDGYFEEEINMVGDDMDDFGGLNDGLELNNGLEPDDGFNPDEGFDPYDGPDPDDDQENFSGFVFQRSNPTSSLTSPHSAGFAATPRDTEGNAIGYAMTSPGFPNSLSPNLLSPHMLSSDPQTAGLGIQGLDLPASHTLENEAAFQQNQQLFPAGISPLGKEDDPDCDNEMQRYENQEFAEDLAAPPEWDDTPFDESIFDNNDTDQFGRPIAGAFAQAQEDRRAFLQDAQKRESDDITSRFSAHSGVSQSTAHTSLSVNGQKAGDEEQTGESTQSLHSPEDPATSQSENPSSDPVAAYQAALAAAANEAALSGKFQRTSSPRLDETPSTEMDQSPNTPGREASYEDDYDYDDGYSYENMADFELDDDAIIAEANASALANDSDGWYGQEFGFYSAPTSQQYGSHNSNPSTEYEFANGGFFGPKGSLDRSTSGRMVSREPNLTPITERSEYSNRNSIMSLNMPGFSSGTPIQSPGLAQLALLGDRGDEMSLSALLRLRSKAWGSSQVSLASSQGSPRSERGDGPASPWAGTFSSPTTYHARKNSVLSVVSQDSEDNGSISGSPTLTGGIPGFTSPPPPVPSLMGHGVNSLDTTGAPHWNTMASPHQLDTVVSPVTDSVDTPFSASGMSPLERRKSSESLGSNGAAKQLGKGHRHKGSADSISYTKEEEDSGATRWVLERRRTGESGQEILERQFVEGGRI